VILSRLYSSKMNVFYHLNKRLSTTRACSNCSELHLVVADGVEDGERCDVNTGVLAQLSNRSRNVGNGVLVSDLGGCAACQ
jgi:hypothetical protein